MQYATGTYDVFNTWLICQAKLQRQSRRIVTEPCLWNPSCDCKSSKQANTLWTLHTCAGLCEPSCRRLGERNIYMSEKRKIKERTRMVHILIQKRSLMYRLYYVRTRLFCRGQGVSLHYYACVHAPSVHYTVHAMIYS